MGTFEELERCLSLAANPPKPFECYHVIKYSAFIGYLRNIRWSVCLHIHLSRHVFSYSYELETQVKSGRFSQTKIVNGTKVFKTNNCYKFFITNGIHFCIRCHRVKTLDIQLVAIAVCMFWYYYIANNGHFQIESFVLSRTIISDGDYETVFTISGNL